MRKLRFRSHNYNPQKKQAGAALLLFILLLVVGATTLLVSKMNKAATQYYRDDVTMKALLKAKEALIGFAVSYPDNPTINDIKAGPGFLPCPDTNGNGSPNPPCGNASAPSYALGKLPWEYIGLDDIRDSAGEQLWYSLSNTFRNNPKSFPLNSDTTGELTLDGNATVEIVAVIMAPGFSFNGQNRPSNTASDYLEDDNNNSDADIVSFASGDFNDNVLVITKQELMAAVEKRVIGEVANVLTQYRNQLENLSAGNGRYPWLSPFADPRVITPLSGIAEVNSPTTLTDTSKDFSNLGLGVRVGDLIQNITDSSSGIITAVTSNTLTTSLFGGTNNMFSVNDNYRVPRLNGAGVGIYPALLSPLDSGVREGHLSSHDQNEAFRTIFTANWTINGASETICSQLNPALSGDHVTDLQNNLVNGNLSAAIDQGICVWTSEEEVNCSMFIEPYSITSNTPDTSSTPVCNPSDPFKDDTDIVKRSYKFQFTGDVINIKNLNGELARDVSTSLTTPFTLTIQDLDLNNEIVGVAVATTSGTETVSIVMTDIFYDLAEVSGLVASGSSGATQQIQDTTKDFNLRGVQPGDWVENTINTTHGRILSIDSPDTITVESKGATTLSFNAGDRYKIYHNLPVWFTQNNWHHLYYVAESGEEVPGGSGKCATSGTNCILVNGLTINGASPPKYNQAVVVSAGSQLASQDRLSATISEIAYFEDENYQATPLDDIFTTSLPTQAFPPQLNSFNDQIRVVTP